MKWGSAARLAVVLLAVFVISGQSMASGDLLKDLESEFIRIVEGVSPAVVEISAKKRNPGNPPDKSLQDSFFQDMFFLQHKSPPSMIVENVGTGIIIDSNGHIVTTESVVGGFDEIDVILADGRKFAAKIVGVDPGTDIALIKIDAEDIPVAVLGDSDRIKSGSWIATMGRSYGRSPTLSFGIVNGAEPLPGKPAYCDAIRINVSVSPGNSGGAVIGTDGKVVGIIAATLAQPRAVDFEARMAVPGQKTVTVRPSETPKGKFIWQGEGTFALPINFVREIIGDLMESGYVERGLLGVSIGSVPDGDVERLGLPSAEGVIVIGVSENSPAHKAGIQKGDVIIKFGDEQIKATKELIRMVAATKPGTEVRLTIMRDKEEQSVSVEIGRKNP